MASQEFNKYAEDDDEDYDDVFGKPNGSCEFPSFVVCFTMRDDNATGLTVNPVCGSTGTHCTDAAAQHPIVKQVLGRSWLPGSSAARSSC